MAKYLESCQRIWTGYKFYACGSSVLRKGFEDVGAANHANDSLDYAATFYRRGESDLEHQAKVAWLASAFMDNFPRFFSEERYYTLPADVWCRLTVALCHDAGEVIIGDVLDDGSSEHDKKDAAEFAAFSQMLVTYAISQHDIRNLYKAFQNKSSHEAMAIVALDKLEAILVNLLLESYGIYGKVSIKDQPTEQDLRFIELAESDAAADVWYLHMTERTLKGFPPEILEPVITLISVAEREVRKRDHYKYPVY